MGAHRGLPALTCELAVQLLPSSSVVDSSSAEGAKEQMLAFAAHVPPAATRTAACFGVCILCAVRCDSNRGFVWHSHPLHPASGPSHPRHLPLRFAPQPSPVALAAD
eukprot:1637801-Prymnesium_polylepis.2